MARVEPANAPQPEREWASLDRALVEATASAFGAQWTEFALAFATIAAAVLAFRYAVIYLDILPENVSRQRWMESRAAQA